MDLIDRAAFRKEYALRERCESCERYGKKDCEYPSYAARDFCGWLDDAPTIEAVPLDKLCEWLAEQDYEIYCYLCHDAFDADGGCPNQVYEKQWLCGSKGHWKAFLTKVMEGWKDEAGS